MSASEKLREMDQGMPHAPTHIATWPSFWELREALPQIVSVVEAAENYGAIQQRRRPVNELTEVVALKLALAALDEALTPQAGGER